MHRVSASSPELLLPNFLIELFLENNRTHFDGFLDEPILLWNPRLRTCAGRFIPGSRKFPESFPAKIEIASYLLKESDAFCLVKDTLGHEMIHYWLWVRRRPYGHSPEFLLKMKEMGVSRYNWVPKPGTSGYSYKCVNCRKLFPARKKWDVLACLDCCNQFSEGKYDSRFKLILVNPVEVN